MGTKVSTSLRVLALRSLKIDPKITTALLRTHSGTKVLEILAPVVVVDLPEVKDAQRLICVNRQHLSFRVIMPR
jgi:signal transduction protein with GAF and PtsI domain